MLHCLPKPGGLYDQDSFIVFGIDIVMAARKDKEIFDEKRRARQRG